MTTTTLHTRRLLRLDPTPSVSFDAVIRFDRDRIASVETDAAASAEGQFPDTLIMPALANAHDHGRGLKTIAYGVADAPVEAWVPATYTLPRIDPYTVAAVAFARMARSGITSVVHCHLSGDRASLLAAAQAVRRAGRNVGIRVAFVVPMRDRHRLGYGPDEAVLACADPEDREIIAERWLRPLPSGREQLELVEEIADAAEEGAFSVQYGPVGAEWCSDELLEAIAGRSAETGRRVHMHLLESRYQREWADCHYKEGLVGRLRHIGLASPRLTVAHGTWLRPEECETLASAGVTVSVNTSSNLRLSSGIAPLPAMKAAGLRTGLGLDALALDDDDDMLREIRLTHLLHRGWGFDKLLHPSDILSAAIRSGACAVCGESALGTIEPDAPADLVVLDHAAMGVGLDESLIDTMTTLMSRSRRDHVRSVFCNGRQIVRDGQVLGIDEQALEAELQRALRRALPGIRADRQALEPYQRAISRYYLSGGHRR